MALSSAEPPGCHQTDSTNNTNFYYVYLSFFGNYGICFCYIAVRCRHLLCHAPRVWSLSDGARLTSDVCLSRTSDLSREQRDL